MCVRTYGDTFVYICCLYEGRIYDVQSITGVIKNSTRFFSVFQYRFGTSNSVDDSTIYLSVLSLPYSILLSTFLPFILHSIPLQDLHIATLIQRYIKSVLTLSSWYNCLV